MFKFLSSKKAVSIFGIMTILIWLSYIFYVPPFIQKPDVKSLSKEAYEAKEFLSKKYESQNSIEKDLNMTLFLAYLKAYIMITVGIIGGVLLLKRRRLGRNIALIMSLIMIGSRIVGMVTHHSGMVGWFKIIYGYLLFEIPIHVILSDIIKPIFFVFSIIFLFSNSISRQFIGKHDS